jgi:hypothetical protein
MARLTDRGARLRVLDFDIENRPLSYLGSDFTTAEVTAIAASWVGKRQVHVWLLGVHTTEEMLSGFAELYHAADVVTGHYIRRHDLPILNGAYLEQGLPTLTGKLTSDTKLDLVRRKELSVSQQSLAEMLGVPAPKYGMSQPAWRDANRLTDTGVEQTRRRVCADVVQHKLLREALLARGLLKPPQRWSP